MMNIKLTLENIDEKHMSYADGNPNSVDKNNFYKDEFISNTNANLFEKFVKD